MHGKYTLVLRMAPFIAISCVTSEQYNICSRLNSNVSTMHHQSCQLQMFKWRWSSMVATAFGVFSISHMDNRFPGYRTGTLLFKINKQYGVKLYAFTVQILSLFLAIVLSYWKSWYDNELFCLNTSKSKEKCNRPN